jgi:natural product precursor
MKISKIKLNQLSKNELDRRALNALKGGCTCTYGGGCRCSSSTFDGVESVNAHNHGGSTNAWAY